jgi:SAM-dependent methyltransferase
MSAHKTSIRSASATDGVTQEWQEEHPAGAFVRWMPQMEAAQADTIARIVAAAGIKPGMEVLDIGSGGGIPALKLAEIVGPAGRVVATDPAAVSVRAIGENARKRGLTNVEAVHASAAGIPFAPESFDAVTCNFGVMFFTDVRAGLSRIREVLRPGARAAFAAWGPPEQNQLFGPFRGTAARYLPEPPETPPADAPNPMRFAAPGSLSLELEAAGLRDVREETAMVTMSWPGPPQLLIDVQLDISRLEDNVPADRREALRADLLAAYQPFAQGDETHLNAAVVIASGKK